MGILHNTNIDEEKALKHVEKIIASNEKIVVSYKLIRDLVIITNIRLIIVDKKGITGRKKMITSYPLNKLIKYQIANAIDLDIDSEVYLYFTGMENPLIIEFSKFTNIYEFNKLLTEQIGK